MRMLSNHRSCFVSIASLAMGFGLVALTTVSPHAYAAKRKAVKKETLVGVWDVPSVDGSPKAVVTYNEDKSYTMSLELADGTKRQVKGKYHLAKPYTIFVKDLDGFAADCRGEGSYDYAQKGDQVFYTLRNDRCPDRIKMFKTTWKKQPETGGDAATADKK